MDLNEIAYFHLVHADAELEDLEHSKSTIMMDIT